MLDPNMTVIALLNADAGVSNLTGTNIWSPRLNQRYKPDGNNYAITVSIRGGPPPNAELPIVDVSFQVVAWAMSSKKARAVQMAAFNVLHTTMRDQQVLTVDGSQRIMEGGCEVIPQDVTDSETGWFTCVGFYRLKMQLT